MAFFCLASSATRRRQLPALTGSRPTAAASNRARLIAPRRRYLLRWSDRPGRAGHSGPRAVRGQTPELCGPGGVGASPTRDSDTGPGCRLDPTESDAGLLRCAESPPTRTASASLAARGRSGRPGGGPSDAVNRDQGTGASVAPSRRRLGARECLRVVGRSRAAASELQLRWGTCTRPDGPSHRQRWATLSARHCIRSGWAQTPSEISPGSEMPLWLRLGWPGRTSVLRV